MRRALVALLGFAAFVSGCGDASSDKAGGKPAGDVRVLRLANANDQPYELEAFAREVERASGGRLRIRFVNDWRLRQGEAIEPGMLDDARAGKVDLAAVGARAFKAEGVHAFDPLLAPFEVTDYEMQHRVVTSSVGRQMLDAVDAAGLHGVALLPGPLRRLAMREPWRGPADLAGKRIIAPAGIGSEAMKALGAAPVVTDPDASLEGLDGIERHLGALGRYLRDAPNVATQPLWPRPFVIVAGPDLWKSLDADDREILVEAGRSAVASTLDEIKAADADALPKLCQSGARFFDADLAALRAAVEPVYASMRRDPSTAKTLKAIEQLRGDSSPPKVACPRQSEPQGGLPPGTYTWTLTREDGRTRPYGKDYGEGLPKIFRAEITAGHMTIMERSSKDAPEEFGLDADYSVFKDRIVIDDGTLTITGRWRVDGEGNLHFSDIRPPGGDVFVFETRPWKRVR